MIVRPATLAALLFAVLALVAAGCGGDDETPSTSGAQATTAPTTAPTEDADAGEQGVEGETEEEREKEEEAARESGAKECSEAGDIDGEPKHQVPEGVVVLKDAHVYESEGPFGKTERFFAAVDGEAADLPAVRDEAAKALEGAGFKTLSTDEEESTEAEAHLQGDKHTVDIQVIALCTGKLRIRYTVS